MSLLPPLSALGVALIVLLGPAAGHAEPLFVGTRALGMGGALRAAATGDTGPLLNPSGMSLRKSYSVEAAYQFRGPGPEHIGHASIVDSTSGFNLAAGLYYNYLGGGRQGPGGFTRDVSGHEGGLALALPFGDVVALGGTTKYVRLASQESMGAVEIPGSRRDPAGLTFDAGLTIQIPNFNIGAVAYNLRDLGSPHHPLLLGGGIVFGGVTGLLVEVDGLVDLTRGDDRRGNELTLMGGVEYEIAGKAALRAGGGREGFDGRGYGTIGASLLSRVGTLDAGFRRDFSGVKPATVFSISARLFVETH